MSNVYEYIRLTDNKHNNQVVRMKNRKWEIYKKGQWVDTGILIKYFFDEDPLYGFYEEITEEEAMKIISNN